MSHQDFPPNKIQHPRTVRGQKKRRGGVGSFKRRGHLVLRGDDWLKRPQTRDLVAWERPGGPAAGCTQLRGACWGGAGVCGNAAQAQQFSAEPPAPLPPRSVSAAPLRSPSRASAGRRHHGPVRHHLLQDRAGLPQPHLLGELAGSRGRGRPQCGAWGPGGRGSLLRGRPGPAASKPLVGSFQGPAEARTVQTRCVGGSGPLARCQGYAGRRGVSLRGALFSGLSLSGRQARNGTLPSESGPLSLSESSPSQWLSPGQVAATWGRRSSPGPGISA